jgi:hypothetical protein
VKFLADASSLAAFAPVTNGVCRGCEGASDLAPLAFPAALGAFADLSSLARSR